MSETITRVYADQTGEEVRSVRGATLRVLEGPDQGKTLELGDRTVVTIGTEPDCDLVLTDDTVSRKHAELSLDREGYLLKDLGSTNGTTLAGVRVREVVLVDTLPPFELGQTKLSLELSAEPTIQALSASDHFGEALGRAIESRRLFALLEKVAATDATVLLTGESGTGKEVLAAAIHQQSPRASGPFAVLDCGGISSSLIESELFGHEAGAFTGANRARAGLFEEASGGTLFIDELGELPLAVQPKLLRALAEKKTRRIGGTKWHDADVRIVAATHRDLGRAQKEGTFRADLYHRIAVVVARVAPLRQRPEDISLLARHFAARLRPDEDPRRTLTPSVMAALLSYDWPGNVRELRNVIERLMSLGDLASGVRKQEHVDESYQAARRAALDRFERSFVESMLDVSGGVVTRAAERSGLSRQMFHRLMSRHGVTGE